MDPSIEIKFAPSSQSHHLLAGTWGKLLHLSRPAEGVLQPENRDSPGPKDDLSTLTAYVRVFKQGVSAFSTIRLIPGLPPGVHKSNAALGTSKGRF